MSSSNKTSEAVRYLIRLVFLILYSVLTANKEKGVTNAQLHEKNHKLDGKLSEGARRHPQKGPFPFTFPGFMPQNTENGPIRGPEYNPHFGYEPYWEGGDWVFKHTTLGSFKCRQGVCLEMFKNFGPLCAENNDFVHKYFENYCEMELENCTTKKEWLMMYRGKCVDALPIVPQSVSFINSMPPFILSSYANYSQSSVKFNIKRIKHFIMTPRYGK